MKNAEYHKLQWNLLNVYKFVCRKADPTLVKLVNEIMFAQHPSLKHLSPKEAVVLFHPGDMVFMDYRWYLESQMSTTYIDALGRPKMILANYDMFRFGIGWSVQPRSMFLESFNQGRCSICKATETQSITK